MKNYLVAALALALLVSAPACHRPFASKERHHPSKEIDTASLEALLEEELALDEDLFKEDDLMAEQEDLLVLEDSEDLFADQEETKEL